MKWVRELAAQLREKGVDASLDQWDLSPGQDISLFMQNGILEADRVLMICTEEYLRKAEEGKGGVGFERLIVTAEVVQTIDTKKFIPLLRRRDSKFAVPSFLGPRVYIDFSEDSKYDDKLDELLRELFGEKLHEKPPLGNSPFSGKIGEPVSIGRDVRSTGITETGRNILDGDWFGTESAKAVKGISGVGLNAHMELRFSLHDEINKSQLELLAAVRKAQIKTFGWPIAVTLESSDEFRPQAYGEGIRAEVPIGRGEGKDRVSYDYWALRSNGDFYLLQSLFEDMRASQAVFFDTRIVRVTEALMFAGSMYDNLGVPPETRLSVRVTHRGLSGRTLVSASSNRLITPKKTKEGESESEIVVVLGEIREKLVDDVKKLVAPMFMLFEFQEFHDKVYEDIVRRFEGGEIR